MPLTDDGVKALLLGEFGDAALNTASPPTLSNEITGGGYARSPASWVIVENDLVPQGIEFPAPTEAYPAPISMSIVSSSNRIQGWVDLEMPDDPVIGTPYIPNLSRVFADLNALTGFTAAGREQVYGSAFYRQGWLAAHSDIPDSTNEITGAGYSRVRVSNGNFLLMPNNVLATTSEIAFPSPLNTWEDISHYGIWSSPTGGELWVSIELDNVISGVQRTRGVCIPAGEIQFDFTAAATGFEARIQVLEKGVVSDNTIDGRGTVIKPLGVDLPAITEGLFGNTDTRLDNPDSASGTAAPQGSGVWVDIVSDRRLVELPPNTMTTGGSLRGTIHYDLEFQFGAVPIKYRTRIRNNGVLIHTIHFTGDPDGGSADFQIPLRDIANPEYTYDLAFQAIGTNYTIALSATNLVVHRGDGAASAAVRAEVSRDTQALAQMVSDLQDAVAALQGDA